jgi:CRP-like cAMP-binding protein
VNIAARLRDVELFKDCSEADLSELTAGLAPFEVEAGTVILRQGDPADGFVLIVDGGAVVTRDDDGAARPIGRAGAGSIVGELALLRGSNRRATVTAETPLLALVGDLGAFGALLDAPGVGPRLTHTAAQRLVAEVHPVEVTLRDGSRIALRPMLATDRDRLTDALDQMSPEAHRNRFFSAAPLSPRMIDYLVNLDFLHHFAWIALPADEPEGALVATGRYVRQRDDPAVAETAFGVEEQHQGRGIATLLLGALAIPAAEAGVERFLANVLSENKSMRAVFDKLDASWKRAEPGVVATEVPVGLAATLVDDAATVDALRASARQIGDAAGVALV